LADNAESEQETVLLEQFSNKLMVAIEKADGGLASVLSKTIKDKMGGFQPIANLNSELDRKEPLNRWLKANNISDDDGKIVQGLEELLKSNMTVGNMNGLIALPPWIPAGLLKYILLAPRSLQLEDLETMKTTVFQQDSFFVTGTQLSEFAWLVRGKPQGDEDSVFQKVQDALQANSSLSERYQLFYLNDPSPMSPEELSMAAVPDPKPVFLVVSKNIRPPQPLWSFYGLSLTTLIGTLFTSYTYGIGTFALNMDFVKRIENGDISVAEQPIPVVLGIFAIQIIHDLGHLITSRRLGQKFALPIFLPSPMIGAFGSVTRLLNFPKSRRALFDFATSGPLAGTLASIAALAAGFLITASASPESLATFPVVPASLFHNSFLAGVISVFTAPTVITADISSAVPVHPLAIAGLSGLIANALNFMPMGQLDGGRAALAGFGRRSASVLSLLTLLLQAIIGFSQPYSILFYWGVLVVFFQRPLEMPIQDEITPLDEKRSIALYLGYLLTVFVLLPFPNFV